MNQFPRYLTSYISLAIIVPIVCILIFVAHIVLTTERYVFQSVDKVPVTEAALIPGAAILRSGDLSPVLKDRADQAIALYEAGKVKKIIASGDNSTLTYNEVQPVRKYLIKNGIPESDIIMDYAGFDTYSSMYRAHSVFQIQSLVVVSQSFHLPRAVYIARHLAIEAYGLNADNGHYKITNYFREMLADSKAVINLIFNRKPKYLGEEVPVEKDIPVLP